MAKIAGDHLLNVFTQQLHLTIRDKTPEEIDRLIEQSGLKDMILNHPEDYLHVSAEQLASFILKKADRQ